MKEGDRLFVRIDHRIPKNEFESNDFEDHIKYLQGVAAERFFVGGGFVNSPGGMILFKAKDFEEAKEICDNDPLILKNLYTYVLHEWNLVIVSDK